MDAVIVTKASAKEIATLVLAIQGQQRINPERETEENDQQQLIHEYEFRLKKLKDGASPGDVIL